LEKDNRKDGGRKKVIRRKKGRNFFRERGRDAREMSKRKRNLWS